MDTVLFLLHIRGLIPLLVFYFRVEEKFARGKFRKNSMRSGYLFRGRTISRKIQFREYSENFLHAKNTCYTVYVPNSHIMTNCRHFGERPNRDDMAKMEGRAVRWMSAVADTIS